MIAPAPREIPQRTTAVGETYATALLPLATARNEARSVLEELERAYALLDGVEDFAVWIAHPGVSAARKLALVESAFRHHVSDLTCDGLLVICRHGRLDRLGEVVAAYRNRLDEAEGRIRVEVVVAGPLEDAARGRLETVLMERLGRLPVLQVKVDPTILGGLIVQAGDRLLDVSVRRQVEELRTALYEKAGLVSARTDSAAGASRP